MQAFPQAIANCKGFIFDNDFTLLEPSPEMLEEIPVAAARAAMKLGPLSDPDHAEIFKDFARIHQMAQTSLDVCGSSTHVFTAKHFVDPKSIEEQFMLEFDVSKIPMNPALRHHFRSFCMHHQEKPIFMLTHGSAKWVEDVLTQLQISPLIPKENRFTREGIPEKKSVSTASWDVVIEAMGLPADLIVAVDDNPQCLFYAHMSGLKTVLLDPEGMVNLRGSPYIDFKCVTIHDFLQAARGIDTYKCVQNPGLKTRQREGCPIHL